MMGTLLFCAYLSPEKEYKSEVYVEKLHRRILYENYLQIFLRLCLMVLCMAESTDLRAVCYLP